MGSILDTLRYTFSAAEPVAQGVGANLGADSAVQAAQVYVVDKEGPFDEAKEDTPIVKVVDFWKDQTVVLHLLRRFG